MLTFRQTVLACVAALAFYTPVSTSAFGTPLNKIAAVVNGDMITAFDVQQQALPEVLRLNLNVMNDSDLGTIAAVQRQVLDTMVSDLLVTQEATRLGIAVTPAEIDNEYRKIVERSQLSQEGFEQQLTQQSMTPDDVREHITTNILRSRLLNHMVTRKVVIDPDDIAAYYEANKSKFVAERKVHIGLVIFAPSSDVDVLVKEAQNGNFAQVAAQSSIGPNPQAGGDIGTVAWNDLSMEWRAVLANMNTGDVSGVMMVEGRKALLHMIENIDGNSLSLDEVSPQIENILREPKLQERFKEYMEQLRSKAVIDIRL
ncbi:MAG: SurA N-terminal domain-containing protein [Pseudomonadota bacterium]